MIQPSAQSRDRRPSRKKPSSVAGRNAKMNSYELNSMIAPGSAKNSAEQRVRLGHDVADLLERLHVGHPERDAQFELDRNDEVDVHERVPAVDVAAACVR